MEEEKTDQVSLSRNSHIPACTECRARKAKCSKQRPSCSHCKLLHKRCVYSAKPARTPLTRQHLTSVEDRVHTLEAAMQKLFPDGPMETIIRSLLSDSPVSESKTVDSDDHALPDPALNFDASAEGILGSDVALPASEDMILTTMADEPMDFESALLSEGDFSDQVNNSELSSSKEESYLQAYFLNYHTIFPFIHEATFLSEYSDTRSHDNTWSILLNMVLATGAWSITDDDSEDVPFFEKAKSHLQQVSMFDRGSITLVQALLLLSDYNQKRGDPKESWHFLGLAVRMAVGLELHREDALERSGLSLLEKEVRRRVWWTVYCFDSCSSKIHGLPLLLPEDKLITVRPVANIHNEALTEQTTTPPSETDDLTIYSGLIQQSSYHRMANNIYRRLLSADRTTSTDIQGLEQMIDNWHSSSSFCTQVINMDPIPEWLVVARDRQLLCDRSLRLLIYRPILLSWLDKMRTQGTSADSDEFGERQSRAKALGIARTTINVISDLISKGRHSRITFYFFLYALFHAVLVPIMHLKGDPASPDSITWLQDIQETRGILSRLSTSNDTLSSCFTVILNQICTPPPSENATHTNKEPAKPSDIQPPSNDIFGNEGLRRVETQPITNEPKLAFSEWIHTQP